MYVMLFMLFVKESRRLNEDPTIELPLIGYLCLRKELLDRVGTNVLSRWKQMYCEKLFRGTKKNYFGGRFTPFRLRLVAIFGQC